MTPLTLVEWCLALLFVAMTGLVLGLLIGAIWFFWTVTRKPETEEK